MKRSNTYVTTVVHSNLSHKKVFDDLRLIVSIFNRAENTSFRLMRQGRLGKNNPNAILYNQMIDRRLYRRVRIAEAAHSDLYLYERYRPSYLNAEKRLKLMTMLRAYVKVAA